MGSFKVLCAMLISIVSLLPLTLHCQTTWAKIYDKSYIYDFPGAFSPVVTPEGNFITVTCGQSVSLTDKLGNIIWEKHLIGSCGFQLETIEKTDNGEYVAAGCLNDECFDNCNSLVVKLDGSGNIIWQKAYSAPFTTIVRKIRQTLDKGFIVAGLADTNEYDFLVFKIDENGNLVWQKTFGGDGWDDAFDIEPTADGGYIVGGYSTSFGEGFFDYWIVKLDSVGNIVWQKAFGGLANEYVLAIHETNDHGYIVIGDAESFAQNRQTWVLKLDSYGNIVWQLAFISNDFYVEGGTLIPLQNGGYIMVVNIQDGNYGTGVISKLRIDGRLAWQKAFITEEGNHFWHIAETNDGGYLISGTNGMLSDSESSKRLLLKLNSDGEIPGCSLIAVSNIISKSTNATGMDTNCAVNNPGLIGVQVNNLFEAGTPFTTTLCFGTPIVNGPALKLTNPFRVLIRGYNFHPDIQVFIGGDEVPWSKVEINSNYLILNKGLKLKKHFPKGIPVEIKLKNGDGGEIITTFTR
jgi:hypothetical protein